MAKLKPMILLMPLIWAQSLGMFSVGWTMNQLSTCSTCVLKLNFCGVNLLASLVPLCCLQIIYQLGNGLSTQCLVLLLRRLHFLLLLFGSCGRLGVTCKSSGTSDPTSLGWLFRCWTMLRSINLCLWCRWVNGFIL